jgi:hypothetical protein
MLEWTQMWIFRHSSDTAAMAKDASAIEGLGMKAKG